MNRHCSPPRNDPPRSSHRHFFGAGVTTMMVVKGLPVSRRRSGGGGGGAASTEKAARDATTQKRRQQQSRHRSLPNAMWGIAAAGASTGADNGGGNVNGGNHKGRTHHRSTRSTRSLRSLTSSIGKNTLGNRSAESLASALSARSANGNADWSEGGGGGEGGGRGPFSLRRSSRSSSADEGDDHNSHQEGGTGEYRRARKSVDGKTTKKDRDTVDSLLLRRKWRRLARHMSTERGRSEVLSSSSSCALTADDLVDGSNALHRACRAGASLDVVRAMCTICPDLAVEVDRRGRTALHIAAAPRPRAVPINAVYYLMAVHGGAVSSRDRDGRLPLHAACCRRPSSNDYCADETADTAPEADKTSSAEGSIDGGTEPTHPVQDDKTSSPSAPKRIGKRLSGKFKKMTSPSSSSASGGKIRLDVVRALCEEAAFAVNEEDAFGLVPAELVLGVDNEDENCGNSNGDVSRQEPPADVLSYLLRRSERRWRRKMSEWTSSGVEVCTSSGGGAVIEIETPQENIGEGGEDSEIATGDCCEGTGVSCGHGGEGEGDCTAKTGTTAATSTHNTNNTTTTNPVEERHERWKARRAPLMRAAYDAHAEAARRRRTHRSARPGDVVGDDFDHLEWAMDEFFGGPDYDDDEEEERRIERNQVKCDGLPTIEFPSAEVRAKMERRISELSVHLGDLGEVVQLADLGE